MRPFGGYANAPVPRRADPSRLQSLGGQTMGTTWSARIDNPSMVPLETVSAAIMDALDRVIAQMSNWEPGSSLTRFNEARPGSRQVLEPEFAEVIACALHWAAESGGAIDPTVGPLVALWGFGSHASALSGLPSPGDIAETRARVGWDRLAFDRAARTLTQPGSAWLDLSGIAKGFAVDQAASALRARGFSDFLVEVGGELRSAGHRPEGQPWQVGVEACDELIRIPLTDLAIATSGNRWHVREHDGRRWSHTIDPRSGEPVRHALSSVTVLHRECMHADALSTVLTVLGPDDGLAFAQRHDIAALFVTADPAGRRLRATDRWADQVRSV